MKMTTVASSHVEAVGHDGNIIHVRYKGGALYTGTCTPEQHATIMGADSIGKAMRESGIKLNRVKEVK